ncbi:MAG: tetratricopeptide repeat protein [Candidatus Hydrogenedentes bacterium]|nr:tetratricopeptide repeat protein [Candidatus Hydrogenedentota bacterium]
MKTCPIHFRTEVVGYCSICGAFGCGDCLTLHEGNLLCAKHYRPIAQRLEEEKRLEEKRKQYPRQRLVVRYADGRREYGVCFAMDLSEEGFHLDLVDVSGATLGKIEYVKFQDLKAVFQVRSFDGKFDKTVQHKTWTPEGPELVVVFRDGEILRGFSPQRYNPNDPRFYLIPKNPMDNNINILVERRMVEGVHTAQEYEELKARKREISKDSGVPQNISHEEVTGDFHFEMRDYETALEHYQQALAKFPHAVRLHKKVVLALYDVGVQHIKRREYDKALAYMERALKLAPKNEHALKKASQLKHILQKESKKV